MNINEWLERTLTSIRSTDPKVLMAKMEQYGLVEDVLVESVFTESAQYNDMAFSGADIVSTSYATNFPPLGLCANNTSVNYKEITFTATPRDAAFSFGINQLLYTSALISSSDNNLNDIAQAA